MHFNTAKLLTYHPYPALLLMTNQALGLNLNPNQVTVKKIESLGALRRESRWGIMTISRSQPDSGTPVTGQSSIPG